MNTNGVTLALANENGKVTIYAVNTAFRLIKRIKTNIMNLSY